MLRVRRIAEGVLVSELELFARRRANMASEGKWYRDQLYREREVWGLWGKMWV